MANPSAVRLLQALGLRVRQLREARELTQAGLAEEAGIGVETVSRLERGLENPTVVLLAQISEVLHVQLPDLFGHAQAAEEAMRRWEIRQIASALKDVSKRELKAFQTLAARTSATRRK